MPFGHAQCELTRVRVQPTIREPVGHQPDTSACGNSIALHTILVHAEPTCPGTYRPGTIDRMVQLDALPIAPQHINPGVLVQL
jgi:hypothetical protein